jgi:DNA-binding protein HU-beta
MAAKKSDSAKTTTGAAKKGERQGRNPATGEAITIKASKTVKFSGSKRLKDSFQ